MSKSKHWRETKFNKGVQEIELDSWEWFSAYINEELLEHVTYIYRGHGKSSWKLEPSLDRVVKSPNSPKRKSHLTSFMYAARGRRGNNPPPIGSENDWWALGQHNGLLTPLLDWTESPFVALYFAMADPISRHNVNCCVWAIAQDVIENNSRRIEADDSIKPIAGRMPVVEIVRPLSDENSRLVNQRALFTRGPNNMDLERWIRMYHVDEEACDLVKILIPNREVTEAHSCLKYLNRMNINHATLFPDLYGASQFCNMELEIVRY